MEIEDRHKRSGPNAPHRNAAESPRPDSNHGGRHDGRHRWLQPVEYRRNGGIGANNTTLDGSPNYAFDGGVGFSPPAEAVQEFKVQTNQFDAQQGYSASANVNVAIKSGGNDLHGALWYFNRDRSRTANAFFANLAGQDRPERTYHRVGGVVNGPVYIPKLYNGRNKTFFLFSYERLKNSEGGDAQFFTVPTAKMRTGDFSELLSQTIPIRIYDPTSGCHAPSTCTVTRTGFTNNVIPTSRLPSSRRTPAHSAWASPRRTAWRARSGLPDARDALWS